MLKLPGMHEQCTNYKVTYMLVSLDKARITMAYTSRYYDRTEHSVTMERTAS